MPPHKRTVELTFEIFIFVSFRWFMLIYVEYDSTINSPGGLVRYGKPTQINHFAC